MTDQTLSAKNVVKAIEARPNGFLSIDLSKARSTKNSTNKYMDNNLVLANGTNKKLGISWTLTPLKGGVKSPEDRKYDATIQFRESSGDLGAATVAIYAEFKRQIEAGISNGTIKAKGAKGIVRSIVQTELENGEKLEDPIIRFKLPFKNGKPDFKLVRIVEDENGTPRPVDIKCTESDVHTLIRSRMITSGYVSMDTVVFSGFGISLPAKVQLLVVKPVENDAPEVDSIMSREEMMLMIGEPDENDDETEDQDLPEIEIEIENVENENTPATDDQLEALRKLALQEEE